MKTYDLCIIGAGVVGAAIARELSRYELKVLWLEKGEDVAVGATRANSAIVHGAYSAPHGTVKGELCVAGNRMYDSLDGELNFGFQRPGSLVLAFDDAQREILDALMENGYKNGSRDMKILGKKDLHGMEPELGPAVLAALHAPETGITSPYEFCIALAENAVANGVTLKLRSEVTALSKRNGRFSITAGDDYEASFVINAAGIHSDRISAMAGDSGFTILPRKGQYLLFQRGYGSLVKHIIFQAPTEKGKGILVTPTHWGNLLVGPDAEDNVGRDDRNTDLQSLREILATARLSVPSINPLKIIRSFSGLRARSDRGDFIIEESKSVPGLIQAAGIESPGLTSSPAIALRVKYLLEKAGLDLEEKEDFHPFRPPITSVKPLLPLQEISEDIKLPPGDGRRIICRCEQVREETILDALRRNIAIDSTDAIKRRTRAGMGACQGNFCTPRVREVIAGETGLAPEKVTLRGESSGLLPERVSPGDLRKLLNIPEGDNL